MKAQQLDQLRGYRQDTYGTVTQARENAYVTNVAKQQAVGQQVLTEPMFNKGKSPPILLVHVMGRKRTNPTPWEIVFSRQLAVLWPALATISSSLLPLS